MIKYILTTKHFFLEGPCGRVSHAKGFVEGLSNNGKYVTLISGKGAEQFIEQSEFIKYKAFAYFFILNIFFEIVKSIFKKEKIVIRWRPVLPFFIFPFLFFYKNIYFEVNSITGLSSNNKIIKNLVKISILFIAKLSRIIVVSANSKDEIEEICASRYDIYIMPNGFDPIPFQKFSSNLDFNEKPNLVYFGKKQDYYDWDVLFDVYALNKELFNNFYIFGFRDEDDSKIYFGTFSHATLIERLSLIKNPILILHPSDTQMAKSGSPMKLFEYASLNLPMIVGNSIQKQAEKLKGIVFYKSGDPEDLTSKLQDISMSYKNYYAQSQLLNKAVMENYTWTKIVSDWLNTLEK